MVDRKDGSNAFGRRYSDRSLSFGSSGSVSAFCVMGRAVLGCALGSWRLLNVRINFAHERGGIYTRQKPVVSLQVGFDNQQVKYLGHNVKPSNW